MTFIEVKTVAEKIGFAVNHEKGQHENVEVIQLLDSRVR